MMPWFALGLAAFTHAAGAQQFEQQLENGVRVSGPGPAGAAVAGVIQTEGGGPRRFQILIDGMDGARVGEALLKACDVNKDGTAAPAEIEVMLIAWFSKADTDTNSALSQLELATALKSYFPVPQPPPGYAPPPEEMAPHHLLARHIMAKADANADGWLTLNESFAYVDQNLSHWDTDSSGTLVASEFAAIVAELFAPDASDLAILGQGKGAVFRSFHLR
jgi:hypothetical protein